MPVAYVEKPDPKPSDTGAAQVGSAAGTAAVGGAVSGAVAGGATGAATATGGVGSSAVAGAGAAALPAAIVMAAVLGILSHKEFQKIRGQVGQLSDEEIDATSDIFGIDKYEDKWAIDEIDQFRDPLGDALGTKNPVSLHRKLIWGSGKHDDQIVRDRWRDGLEKLGFATKNEIGSHEITLADGSKYDIGRDGRTTVTGLDGSEIRPYNTDPSDQSTAQAIGLVQPLGAIMSGGTQNDKTNKIFTDGTGYFSNAAQSNAGGDINIAKENARSFYEQMFAEQAKEAGLPVRRYVHEQLALLRDAELITEEEFLAFSNGVNQVYDEAPLLDPATPVEENPTMPEGNTEMVSPTQPTGGIGGKPIAETARTREANGFFTSGAQVRAPEAPLRGQVQLGPDQEPFEIPEAPETRERRQTAQQLEQAGFQRPENVDQQIAQDIAGVQPGILQAQQAPAVTDPSRPIGAQIRPGQAESIPQIPQPQSQNPAAQFGTLTPEQANTVQQTSVDDVVGQAVAGSQGAPQLRAAQRDKILWKPTADHSGNLVVLFPYKPGTVTIRDADTGEVLGTGHSTGASNGFADTIRFDQPGGAYNNVILEDSTGTSFHVQEGQWRYENLGTGQQGEQVGDVLPEQGMVQKPPTEEIDVKAQMAMSMASQLMGQTAQQAQGGVSQQIEDQKRSEAVASLINPVVQGLSGGLQGIN